MFLPATQSGLGASLLNKQTVFSSSFGLEEKGSFSLALLKIQSGGSVSDTTPLGSFQAVPDHRELGAWAETVGQQGVLSVS